MPWSKPAGAETIGQVRQNTHLTFAVFHSILFGLTGSERSSVWHPLQTELKRRAWHSQRFEDKAQLGLPDVNIHVPGHGDLWAEMKFVRKLPARANTPVQVGLRKGQCVWLTKAIQAGRVAGVLAKVAGKFYWWTAVEDLPLLRDGENWAVLQQRARCFDSVSGWLSFTAVERD